VTSVAFSHDGNCIISGSGDRTIRVWDAETQQQIGQPLQGHEDWVTSVAFSHDGNCIISGSGDRTIRVWDAEIQQQIGQPLQGHEDSVTSVAFSHGRKRIIPGSDDRTIHVWDEEMQGHLDQISHTVPAFHIFSHDGKSLSMSVTVQSDGWVLGPNFELLFWVPSHLIPQLPRPHLIGICGPPMITFEISNFHHGQQWTKCMKTLDITPTFNCK